MVVSGLCGFPWLCLALMRAFEPEGELGTDPDGLAGFVEQMVGYVTVADDRETPVVQSDQLGEDLGAQSSAVAGDEVEPAA